MTSPSVYLVFDHLQAMSSTNLDPTCSLSSPLGATGTLRSPGGGAIRPVGGPYTNAVVSLDATGLSSLVRDLGPINTASVVSEIAHGGPSYSYWINAVRGTGYNYGTGYYSSVMSKSVDYANFMVPDAEAYYMNINGAPGCNRMGDHPQCSTIYDGAYKAQLLVPREVRTLRPEWAECFDPLFGALDPPIALTQVATMKVPTPSTEPAKETTSKETSPSDQPEETNPATPGHTLPSDSIPTPPPPKSSPTALPETSPDDEPNTQDPSNPDDESAGDEKPNDNTDPPNTDDSSNNGNPSESDKPNNNGDPSDSDASSNSDNASNSGNASNSDNSSDDDKPKDNGGDSSKPTTQDGTSAGKPQNDASESSPPDDQNAGAGEDSGKKPQNALDVLSAAQQSDEAKATASPGSESSGNSGSSGSANSGNSDDEDGSSGATGSGSESGGSGGIEEQGSGSNTEANESSGQGTSTNDQNSGEDNGDSAGSAAQTVDIDGTTHTVAEQNGVPMIDGNPLPTDGSPMTVDGQTVSAVDGGIVIGTQTIDLAGAQTADLQAAVFTANGQAFTAVPGSSNELAVVDGTTLSVGGQAVTAHGATLSAASNGIVVDGSTIGYEAAANPSASPAVLTFGPSNVATASAIGSGVFVIGSATLTAGGSDATISGHTVSAAVSGVVVDGSSSRSTDASETRSGQEATQTTSDGQDGQPSATGSGASRLDAMLWVTLSGCGLVLLLL